MREENLFEVMKACRTEPLTQAELEQATGLSKSCVRRAVVLLVKNGLFNKRLAEKPGALFNYALAEEWGGKCKK